MGCADPTGLFDMIHHDWAFLLAESIGVRADQLPHAFRRGRFSEPLPPLQQKNAVYHLVYQWLRDRRWPNGWIRRKHYSAGMLIWRWHIGRIGAYSENYKTHPSFRTMYGGIPYTYLLETALMGGGFTLNWFHEHFARSG